MHLPLKMHVRCDILACLHNSLRRCVERAGRLIEQQQPRVGNDGTRDGNPLLLSAGQRDSRRRTDERVVALEERNSVRSTVW